MALTLSNYAVVFAASFILSALPLIVVLLFVAEPVRETPSTVPITPVHPPRSPLSWRSLLPVIGFGFLVTGSAEMLNGLIPILATQHAHLSES